MFCSKCGKQISDNSTFCLHCGTPVIPVKPRVSDAPETPVPPQVSPTRDFFAPMEPLVPETPSAPKVPVTPVPPAVPVRPVVPTPPATPKVPKAPKEKKPLKKSQKALIWLVSIAVVLIAAVIALFSAIFPLKVTIENPSETETRTGIIAETEIVIHANQPIREISYAMSAEDAPTKDAYQVIQASGGMFEKTLILEDLHIAPGETELYISVKTMFGSHKDNFTFICDIGQLVTPSPEDIIYLSDDTQVVREELLITFSDSVSEEDAEDIIEDWGGKIIGVIYPLNLYQVRFADLYDDAMAQKAEQILENKNVAAVSFNTVYTENVSLTATPNDSKYDSWKVSEPAGNNWHMECIDAPGAWDHHEKLQTTPVGVLDSTLFHNHEDIQVNKSKYLYLGTENLNDADEYNEGLQEHVRNCNVKECDFCGMLDHGTHVSGIIAAVDNNKKGVSGVAWNADLYFSNAWTYDSDDTFSYSGTSTYLYAISYMAMSGCRVINMSLGSSEPSAPGSWGEDWEAEQFEEIFKKLEKAGYDFLLTKSAGNDNANASSYRLNRILTAGKTTKKHVIIVASIGHSGMDLTPIDIWPTQYSVANSSNYGDLVDIAAPGVGIYSTINNGYGYMGGTSMAAPMVAGVATMVYGANPNLKAPDVKKILTQQVNQYCAKKGTTYPIVNAHMAVEKALNMDELKPMPKPEAGFITGFVQDAKTGDILQNAWVRATNEQTGELIISEGMPNGEYYIFAESGTYTMEFLADGYIPETIYNVQVETGVVKYNVRLNMVPSTDEDVTGTVTGTVIDAFDASKIPNAVITIYRGIDNLQGEPVTTLYSDEYGKYTITLSPGNYTMYVSADNYTSGTAGLLVVDNETRDNQNCTLTPILNPGELRVVLTWGQYPKDLDSHLVGPTPDGGKFHIFYKEKNYYHDGTKYNNLDVDDTDSYGPETTSVYVGIEGGTYTFYVHDFSNRNLSTSNAISTAEATVKVYIAGVDTPYVFNAPTEEGTLWEVFSVKDGLLTVINKMSYESNDNNVGQ